MYLSNKAFVSLAGEDRVLAERILEASSKFLYDIYFHDFVDGETLIARMNTAVGNCSLLIFLASQSSIRSVWCKHELNLAQIEAIRRGLKVVVVPLEAGIDVNSIPEWMRAYWMSLDVPSEKALIRRVSRLLQKELIPPITHGAIERVEEANRQRLLHMKQTQLGPNVFIFSGAPSIGRRTTAAGFLARMFGNDMYQNGPEIPLEDPASIEDLYFRLRAEFYVLTKPEYEKEQQWFRSKALNAQVDEILGLLKKISDDAETAFILSPSGLCDDKGFLISWAKELITKVCQNASIRLIIISNRQPRSEELQALPKVFWYHVRELGDEFIVSLVQEVSQAKSGKMYEPGRDHLVSIGGHPLLAHAYSNMVSQYGDDDRDTLTGTLSNLQRAIMSDFLSYDHLLDDEKTILTILSWVPRLQKEHLTAILERCGFPEAKDALRELVLSCLVSLSGGYYSIAAAVRMAFRQLHGYGDEPIRKAIADFFSEHLAQEDDYNSELLDSALFVIALERGQVPQEFRNLIAPSTILRITRALYQRGRTTNDRASYDAAISLADMALAANVEEPVAIEIAAVKIRCLLRLKRFPDADASLRELEKKQSRHALVLRAQYHRHKGDFGLAAVAFSTAISAGLGRDPVLHEYCICLKKLGDFKKIREVIERFSDRVEQNAYLLDLKISFQLGRGDFQNADNSIKRMRQLDDDNYASWKREAILIAKTTQNIALAEQTLNKGIELAKEETGQAPSDLYATRCVLRAKAGRIPEARADYALVQQTHRHAEQVCERLNVHILAGEKHYDEALNALEAIQGKTSLDTILRKEVLFRVINDNTLPGYRRDEAQEELSKILPHLEKLTEFEIL